MATATSWEQVLINSITEPQELLRELELDQSLLSPALAADKIFPLRVPRSFVARMEKGNPKDPLLRQVLPVAQELGEVTGYSKDPLFEANTNPLPGILHKYQGRALLTLMGTCAINCRYCFRRHFDYEKNNPGTQGWEKVLAYINDDPSIHEVILSGGEPLINNDKTLTAFSDKLAKIPHIKRLRIHTRVPIVLPERINQRFLEWVKQIKMQVVMVIHCNHPHEIDANVTAIIKALRQHEVILLNQSVILKGVNDKVEILAELSEKLFSIGVQPYYLHALDKVEGAAHFDLELQEIQELHWNLSKRLSGYLVPKLVYEKAGASSKISLESRVFCTEDFF